MLDARFAPVNVYLSAGSNIAPEANLQLACQELESEYGDLVLSSVYQNRAVGFAGDDFLNMVIAFSTHHHPERIIDHLERLHDKSGRVRGDDPFSSRTLDLDLLLYGDLIWERLKVPREDIEKYAFVLGPLAEVAPDLRHPVTGVLIGQIWDNFDQDASPLTRVDIGIEQTELVYG